MTNFSYICSCCGFQTLEDIETINEQNGYGFCAYCKARHKIEYKIIIKKVEYAGM